jgi:uncharacterized NAD(P)/FAD-binding protein YdhS
VRQAVANADDWRTVIDGLRPVTVALWQDLPEVERSRFLRHLARRWEVARHRMAPHPARQLRQGTTAPIDAAVVVDCTGPTADPAAGTDPLLHDLLAGGLARRDVNGVGIQTGADGAVVDAAGRPSSWLYAVGVLRRGSEWETTAIPELRTQAVALARLFSTGPRRAAA